MNFKVQQRTIKNQQSIAPPNPVELMEAWRQLFEFLFALTLLCGVITMYRIDGETIINSTMMFFVRFVRHLVAGNNHICDHFGSTAASCRDF